MIPTLTINPPAKGQKKISVQIDAAQLERLAANFGFFNAAFLESIEQAEREAAQSRTKILRTLRDLRRTRRA